MSDNDPSGGGLLDVPALEQWLDANAPQVGSGPLQATRLEGGVSNAVFRITRGGEAVVLRRPPRVPRPDSERVIEREARVLGALNGSAVPRPDLIAYCDDPAIIGVKFYLMSFIDGFRLTRTAADPPPYDDPTSQAYGDLAYALVSGISRLALVDYKAVGLEGFGKPDNFLERQVDRWFGQLESYKTADGYASRAIEGMDYLGGWLRANRPETRNIGIIHGDYSFANSMYHYGPAPRLAAMIDWELATIGDTMLDVGSVLYGFRSRSDTTPAVGFFGPEHFPFREDLAQAYAQDTGRSVEHLDFYVVLAIFKLAAIMEGHVARGLAGKSDPARVKSDAEFVDRITAKAVTLARAAG
jgi:aminoglycoside phosphotransferase (APT) family kinase protein